MKPKNGDILELLTEDKFFTYKQLILPKNIAAVSCSPLTYFSAGVGLGLGLTGKLGRACRDSGNDYIFHTIIP